MQRYKVKPAELRYGERKPGLYFILDTKTGILVRGKNDALRSFKERANCEKAVEKCNAINAT